MNTWHVQAEHNTVTNKHRYFVNQKGTDNYWTSFDSSNNIIRHEYLTRYFAQRKVNKLNKQQAINNAWTTI